MSSQASWSTPRLVALSQASNAAGGTVNVFTEGIKFDDKQGALSP